MDVVAPIDPLTLPDGTSKGLSSSSSDSYASTTLLTRGWCLSAKRSTCLRSIHQHIRHSKLLSVVQDMKLPRDIVKGSFRLIRGAWVHHIVQAHWHEMLRTSKKQKSNMHPSICAWNSRICYGTEGLVYIAGIFQSHSCWNQHRWWRVSMYLETRSTEYFVRCSNSKRTWSVRRNFEHA